MTKMYRTVFLWKVECYPFEHGPINSMTIVVVARDRKEAELIVLDQAHKFFDQDMRYKWSEPLLEGYQEE